MLLRGNDMTTNSMRASMSIYVAMLAVGLAVAARGRAAAAETSIRPRTHSGGFESKQMTVGGGSLVGFWATVETKCEQFSGEKRGEVRFNVEVGPSVEPPLTTDVQRADALTVPVATEGFSGTSPTLTASGRPEGSVFTDQGGGTADLSWTPGFDQTADQDVTFRADDGAGSAATTTTRIGVGVV